MSEQNKQSKVKLYRVIFEDSVTHTGLWVRLFTKQGLILMLVSCVVALLVIFYVLFAFTPLKTAIPGYPNSRTKREAIQNAIKIDSLETVISRWEFYSDNLLLVAEGKKPVPVDSVITMADDYVALLRDPQYLRQRDSLLRETVETEETEGKSAENVNRVLPIEGVHFFTPLKGVVSKGYENVYHPYIDITAPANSVVMSVLEGTVLFDGWMDESGYIIMIQHSGDIVSVYKHCQKLLKKSGDVVSAGTPIALIGSSAATGDHLRLEIWHKGEPVDPSQYLNF